MVRLPSARPSGGGPAVPAKMTSSILPPRRLLAPCSPITQLSASTTLDFPDPFGPTTHVMPGSRRSVVADANDLKPRMVRVFRCTSGALLTRRRMRPVVPAGWAPAFGCGGRAQVSSTLARRPERPRPFAPRHGQEHRRARGTARIREDGPAGRPSTKGSAGVGSVDGGRAGGPRGGGRRGTFAGGALGAARDLAAEPGRRRRADRRLGLDPGPHDGRPRAGLPRPLVPLGRRRLRQDRGVRLPGLSALLPGHRYRRVLPRPADRAAAGPPPHGELGGGRAAGLAGRGRVRRDRDGAARGPGPQGRRRVASGALPGRLPVRRVPLRRLLRDAVPRPGGGLVARGAATALAARGNPRRPGRHGPD